MIDDLTIGHLDLDGAASRREAVFKQLEVSEPRMKHG
jgi:hypothetical protein